MGLRNILTSWMSPGTPPTPITAPEAEGRITDFRPSINLSHSLKADDDTSLDFATLRRLAEPSLGGLTLLRLAIEKRKDSMSTQYGELTRRDGKKLTKYDQEIAEALRYPDRVHTYDAWQRMLLEDMLVLDAAVIYCASDELGKYPEAIDGSTVALRIDEHGRKIGYQQILYGQVVGNYSRADMIYAQRNPRTHTFYGLSPVEQAINMVALALKKEVSQHAFFDQGSTPDGVITAPPEWGVDKIARAQDLFDAMLAGKSGERRKARWLPNGAAYQSIQPLDLKDGFDDLLVRAICYAFSLSATALVRAENRAVAETAKESAQEEGLEPIKIWWSSVMDRVLSLCFGAPHLTWIYQDEEIIDAATKASVLVGRITSGTITADEVRAAYGEEPLTRVQRAEIAARTMAASFGGGGGTSQQQPAQQLPTEDGGGQQQGTLNGAQIAAVVTLAGQVAKGEISKDAAIAILMAGFGLLREVASAMLGDTLPRPTPEPTPEPPAKAPAPSEQVAVPVVRQADEAPQESEQESEIAKALKSLRPKALTLTDNDFVPLWGIIEGLTIEAAQESSAAGMRKVLGIKQADTLDELLAQANEDAVAWAKDRAGESITEILSTTRDRIKELTAQAIDEGWTTKDLDLMIDESGLFGADRAEMIARTERATASTEGTMIGWKRSGVVDEYEWLASADDTCPQCQALNGKVFALDGKFERPPLHPQCRCDILPVAKEITYD